MSSDWDVVHPDYGWQDAYNVMITREDFMGDDNELRVSSRISSSNA